MTFEQAKRDLERLYYFRNRSEQSRLELIHSILHALWFRYPELCKEHNIEQPN